MNIPNLIARVSEHGYRIDVTLDGPRLIPTLPGAKLPADLLDLLKRFRVELIRYLTCSGCGRAITCEADRERVRDAAFCDKGACPYKR